MVMILENAVYHYPYEEGHINVQKKNVSKKDLVSVCAEKSIERIEVESRIVCKLKRGKHSESIVRSRGTDEE